MAAYLDRFEHDIFLSYAWSGNIDADGDKGWAFDLRRELQLELSARLKPPVSIFLDTETATNGNVDREFSKAIANSALFLAIVTPSFCDEKCFCRKEVEWFAGSARAISSRPNEDIAKRFFQVISRPVDRKTIPVSLQGNFELNFYDGDPGPDLQGYTLKQISAIKSAQTSRLQESFSALVLKLAGYLVECKQMQRNYPIRRVFLAETASRQREKLIAALKPHEVTWVSRTEQMSDLDFETATTVELAACDRSVHIVAAAEPLDEGQRPAFDVQRTFEVQLGRALAVRKPGFRTVVWRDNQSPVVDEAFETFLQELPTRYPNTETLEDFKQGYEDLASYLIQICTEVENPVPPALPEGYCVYLQCSIKDFDRLVPIYNELYAKGIFVRFPVFEGKKVNVNRRNDGFLQEANVILFYWGAAPQEDMLTKCDRTLEVAGSAGKPFLLGLDPYDDFRRINGHDRFKKIPFPAAVPQNAIQALQEAIQLRAV